MTRCSLAIAGVGLLLLPVNYLVAGPYLPAGDAALRHDVQMLADAGVIGGPVSSWPLAWGSLLEDLRATNVAELPPVLQDSIQRLNRRAARDVQPHQLVVDGSLSVASDVARVRGFQDSPRGEAEAAVTLNWSNDRFAIQVGVQAVDAESDSQSLRADDSLLGVVIGNWSIAASTQQRWWGPGWDGSIILSNNARPIPSLVIDRLYTDAPESRWLSWLGPWDVTVMFGELESDRAIPNARFFAMRAVSRPLSSLEVGISRSAQWCGDGRPCGAEVFADLFLGNDNIGDAGIGEENEPGNQMAGIDARWSFGRVTSRWSIYGQFIGEDEAGGLPSRFLGQFGVDWSGTVARRWSTRVFAEFAGTACQFYESSKRFNCGYNQSIYKTGYRYRGRTIGHGADNDSEVFSVGALLSNENAVTWSALLRTGTLNAGGAPDSANTLTPVAEDIASIELMFGRRVRNGYLRAGVGYDDFKQVNSGHRSSDFRAYVRWQSSY